MSNSRRVGVCDVRKAHRGPPGFNKSCCALIRVREIRNSREKAKLESYLANVSESRTSCCVQFCTGAQFVSGCGLVGELEETGVVLTTGFVVGRGAALVVGATVVGGGGGLVGRFSSSEPLGNGLTG